MICPKCKTENDADAHFCENCGTRLSNAHDDVRPAAHEPVSGKKVGLKRRLKKVLWCIIGATIGIYLLFGCVLELREPRYRFDTTQMCINDGHVDAYIVERHGKVGVVGGFLWHKIIPCKYEMICHKDGTYAVKLDGKWGFFNRLGRDIIPPKYDIFCAQPEYPSYFMEGLAPVAVGEKWGFIDRKGKTVIPFQYDRVLPFMEGLAVAYVKGKGFGYIDRTGETVIPFCYYKAENFSESLAAVTSYKGDFFINKVGNEAFPGKYFAEISSFHEGYARVSGDGLKWGLLNKRGELVIPMKYDAMSIVSEGVICVRVNDKWGYVDIAGHEITPLKYDDCRLWNTGRGYVEIGERWGYVDRSGREEFY
ncbi:MAG: WG repeat-containing protein [Bacteroides cellulosilyticus]|nr:WG repeat-containing protein [Bacteroides cellulosilyticus]